MITPVSKQGISFEGAQYIFSEIDDVDADSFYQSVSETGRGSLGTYWRRIGSL